MLPNFVDVHNEDFLTLDNAVKTLGNLLLMMPNSRINARTDFFSVGISMVLNKLSEDMVNAKPKKSYL